MRVLGIDNGVGGGLVVVSEEGIVCKASMPIIKLKKRSIYDVNVIATMIRSSSPGHIFIEKAQAFPGQGVTSMFHYGEGFGIVQGVAAALGIPTTLVTPQAWQKVMFEGLSKEENTKTLSLIVCKRLWPQEDWIATERSKKAHTGMTDAACIAMYGLRKLTGGLHEV